MLRRLLLLIHWLAVFPAIFFIVLSAKHLTEILVTERSFFSDFFEAFRFFKAFLWFVSPAIIFSIIYWVVKKKWVYFPWQHIKQK